MQHPPPQPAQHRRRNPWIARVAIFFGVVVILMVFAGFVFKEPILRYLLEREAQSRGLRVEFDEFDFEFGRVELRRARFSPVGFSGIAGTAERLAFTWDGLWIGDIRRLEASAVGVEARGSAADIAIFLSEWARAFPGLFEAEVAAKPVNFLWRGEAQGAEWLAITGGALAPVSGGVDFTADSAIFSGVSVGSLGARWQNSRGSIALGFGKNSIQDAPITIELDPKNKPPAALVTLKPSTMADLGNPLGLQLPTEKAQVEGTAKILLPDTIKMPMPGQGALSVELNMVLRGYVPPHPKELNRIIFGDKTNFSALLELGEDRSRVTISNAQVSAGAFSLKGTGKIERKGAFSAIEMNMNGAVRCVDVAQSAVSSHLGDAAGTVVGDIAKNSLKGVMNVSVHIEADTRDLSAAKVQQQVKGNCGISIPLPAIPTIKLPDLGELPPIPKL